MKKFYQSIAVVALLGIGIVTSAQTMSLSNGNHRHLMSKAPAVFVKKANTNNVTRTEGMNHIQMKYYQTESNLFTSSYSVNANPGWDINMTNFYTNVHDTGTAPHQVFNLSNWATVAFDTIVDPSDASYSASAGSVVVDTIQSIVLYKNTSTQNDTLLFQICSVAASGYPTVSVLRQDTIILNRGGYLPGDNLDTIYPIGVLPAFTISTGTRFCVNMVFRGSKLDTFLFCYGFPSASCGGNFNYCSQRTAVGHRMATHGPLINSFIEGWEDYQPSPYHAVMWPNAAGYLTFGSNGDSVWNMCSGATMYMPMQDIAIEADITFNDVTGINKIAANNSFSIGQNYPNPFNKNTQITYNLTQPEDVMFSVYDVTGRELINTNYNKVAPGQHEINLDANVFTPGIYFYTFNVGGTLVTKKMIITQ
jgi:hypothetical protein